MASQTYHSSTSSCSLSHQDIQMELQHFSHDHPLILKEVQKEGEGDEIFCYGCEKVILDFAYSCGECSYFLHKSCVELPRKVEHSLHSKHLLTLSAHSPRKNVSNYYVCDTCAKDGDRFYYFCSPCNFNICISCFMEEREITNELHEHPLALIFRPASIICNVCLAEHEDTSYICLTCQFLVHKSCVSLPKTINRRHHNHPLTLIYQYYPNLTNFVQHCRICDLFIPLNCWAYCCARCRYFIHVRCSIMTPESLSGGESESEGDQSTDPNLLHLPMTDGSIDLFTHFSKYTNLEDVEREVELTHWSHDHPLILFDVQKDDDIKDEIILCDGCMQPISFPFYGCGQCNYFLHLNCVYLPGELQHPIHHEHPMEICQGKKFYEAFRCSACYSYTNGFFYRCEKCEFIFDVKCVLLPTSIAHQAHKHPLVQMIGSELFCKACRSNFSTIGFRCDACKYNLCNICALLPRNIRHRWDKHPLSLSYPPFSDHPDEFHCEMCEEEINPHSWIYHCSDCDQSFHLHCIKDRYSNVKYGSALEVNCHPHPLTFVRKAKKKSSYYSCGGYPTDSVEPIFECGECNYTSCLECITQSILT